jgi:hypothetical protein
MPPSGTEKAVDEAEMLQFGGGLLYNADLSQIKKRDSPRLLENSHA